MKRVLALAALLAWSSACIAAALESYGRLPLAFEANLGQTDARVKFLARTPGMQLFITPTEAVYRLDGKSRSSVVRMSLAGARRDADVRGIDRLPGQSHYLAGGEGGDVTRVPHFGRVEIDRVYRGIDLAFYGNGSQLEYDFRVASGADPRAIAIDVHGAERVEIDAEGQLLIHTAAGTVAWKAPGAYQQRDAKRLSVHSAYVLRGKNRVGFRMASYDRRLPLVIDPVLAYATLIGGTGFDTPFAIAVGADQGAVITGSTSVADFPTTPGAYDRTSGGIFVTKLNAAGSALVYSTFLGPGRGTSVAIHGGRAYITGRTTSNTLVTPGALNNGAPGNRVFVAKLLPDGSGLEYGATIVNGADDPHIAVDASGNAHVVGTISSSAALAATPGAYQATFTRFGFPFFQADLDVFYAKLNATGSALLYASYLGSSELDEAGGIGVDASGAAYVTGRTQGRSGPSGGFAAADIPFPTTAGAFQRTFTGVMSTFVAKFDPTASGAASLVYSTLLGDNGLHHADAIAVNGAGNVYVTGVGEASFPLTTGSYGVDPLHGGGAFVTKLNAAGSGLVYSAMIAGGAGLGIAIDGAGSAFVAGMVTGGFGPVNALPGMATVASGLAFLTKLTPSGAIAEYSTRLQGTEAVDVAVDPFGAAYVFGDVAGTPFTATPGAFQGSPNGTFSDAFVSKVTTNRPPVADAGADRALFAGQTFTLDGGGSFDPDGDPLTYAWTEGTQAVSPLQSVSLSRSMGVYVFTLNVSDGAASASDSVTVTVLGSLTIDLFGLGDARVTSSDGQIDCTRAGLACFARFDTPTAVTLTALPGTGIVFLNWSNACSGTGFCAVTVNGNIRVGASFDVQQVPLSVAIAGNGKVTSMPAGINCATACTSTLPYGTSIELNAVADAGYRFTGWSGDCAGAATTCTLDLTTAKSASAAFSEITLDAISISPATATIAVGGRQRFTLLGTFSDGTTRPLSADRSVDASDDSTCAITRSGSVRCFGGFFGAPTRVGSFQQASMLAAGTAHFCALFGDGTVNCDGAAIGLSGVTAIAAGASGTTCALLSDATIRCWNTGAAPMLAPLSGNAPPIAIAADGGQPACAVLADRHVSCVGYTAPVAGVEDAIATAVGVFHACALIADGRVKCWGDNDWGQLGRGTVNPTSQPQPADFVLEQQGAVTGPIEGVVSLVSGDYYMCALSANGAVKCWGSRIGDPTPALAGPLAQVVTANAVTVAAGAFHACAVLTGGTLRCWGFNFGNSLLGNPSSTTPVTIAGMSNIVTASWSGFPPTTANIAANGIAAGRAAGNAAIVATAGALTASATLTIVNTPTGTDIEVQPSDTQSGATPVTVTFSEITQIGSTSLTINPGSPGNLPPGFRLGSPEQYYEITTTAGYVAPITICIHYAGIMFNGPPQLFHLENGRWVDRTILPVDTANQVVCAEVSSLSPFVLLERVNRAPHADAGDDVTAECTTPTGTPMRLDGSRSSDPDGDALTFDWRGSFGRAVGPSPMVTLPLGLTTATLTVSDGRTTSSDTVGIVVRDTTAPEIAAASANPALLWPPNHKMIAVTVSATVRDRCDAAPRCRIASVVSNEPVNGLGDGDTSPDWKITGDLTVDLRAERAGGGDGRVYGIGLRCMDASGNASARIVNVNVAK